MDKGAKQLGRRMLAIYRETDPVLADVAQRANVSCRPGCAACCYIQVPVSLPEAVAIVEPLLKDRQAIGNLMNRCYKEIDRLEMDRVAHFKAQVPCMFLSADKRCTVYERRPDGCRTHLVVSAPENCEAGADDTTVARLDTVSVTETVMGEALRALKQRQIPLLIAPMPVAVLWAIKLLVEGEVAFRKAIEQSESFGKADMRVWTAHLFKTYSPDARQAVESSDESEGQ